MRDGRWIVHHDGDDVEANFVPVYSGPRCVGPGSPHDVALFFVVNVALRGGMGVGRAGFHFHEDDQLAEAGDDVDFRILAWFVIARNHLEAGALQVAVSQIFTTLPQGGRFS